VARRPPDTALLALVQVLFGSLSVAGKLVLPQVGPYVLLALRVGVAAALLLLLERVLVHGRVARKDWPVLVVLSLLGVVINQVFFLVGLSLSTAVEATLLITTIPVFTLTIAIAWGREAWSARKAAGMAVAFAGVALLVGGALEFGTGHLLGDAFVVINAFSYSIFLVASRPVLERIPPLTMTARTFLVAVCFTLPLGLLHLGDVQAGGPTAGGWAAMAYIILGPTVGTYFLVNHVLMRAHASRVAVFVYLQPLVAAVLAILLLHEPLTPRVLAAGALIFVGVGLATLQRVTLRRRLAPGA